MWYTFPSFDQFPVYLNRGAQPFANQAHGFAAFDFAVKQLQQIAMVNFIVPIMDFVGFAVQNLTNPKSGSGQYRRYAETLASFTAYLTVNQLATC